MTHSSKAILLVSFGTSIHTARKATIDQLKDDLQKEFPDCSVYCAWTSQRIIQQVLKQDQIHIMTITEAMKQMHTDGIRELLVQPTFILNGPETELMLSEIAACTHHFENIRIGSPLLASFHDYIAVISALKREYAALPANEVLIFMEHGTAKSVKSMNSTNFHLALQKYWHSNVFAGAMKDADFIRFMKMLLSMKKQSSFRIHLIPFLFTAGRHAVHDMAGDQADSWKNIFQREGYEVVCHMKGLGEYPAIRRIFVEHAHAAVKMKQLR